MSEKWVCFPPSEQDRIRQSAAKYLPHGTIFRVGRNNSGDADPHTFLAFRAHPNAEDPSEAILTHLVDGANELEMVNHDWQPDVILEAKALVALVLSPGIDKATVQWCARKLGETLAAYTAQPHHSTRPDDEAPPAKAAEQGKA